MNQFKKCLGVVQQSAISCGISQYFRWNSIYFCITMNVWVCISKPITASFNISVSISAKIIVQKTGANIAFVLSFKAPYFRKNSISQITTTMVVLNSKRSHVWNSIFITLWKDNLLYKVNLGTFSYQIHTVCVPLKATDVFLGWSLWGRPPLIKSHYKPFSKSKE